MRSRFKSAFHRTYIAVLIKCRREHELNQRELAKRLKKPHSWVSKVETGQRRLYFGEFFDYATALEEDPRELFARIVSALPSRSRPYRRRKRRG